MAGFLEAPGRARICSAALRASNCDSAWRSEVNEIAVPLNRQQQDLAPRRQRVLNPVTFICSSLQEAHPLCRFQPTAWRGSKSWFALRRQADPGRGFPSCLIPPTYRSV
jgi:hypothetical protein